MMRNILLVQIETKTALVIVLIVVVIFSITLFKSISSFNKFIEDLNARTFYEEIDLQTRP